MQTCLPCKARAGRYTLIISGRYPILITGFSILVRARWKLCLSTNVEIRMWLKPNAPPKGVLMVDLIYPYTFLSSYLLIFLTSQPQLITLCERAK